MNDQFFWLGALFGFVAATAFLFLMLLTTNSSHQGCCEFDQPILGCGRGFVDECPSACYDVLSGSLLRFEYTESNMNIIIENTGNQRAMVMPEFIVTEYWIEDGYYYADIDDLIFI